MSKIDLREYKKEIRAQMRKIRREMPPDVIREKNDQIFRRLVATQQYRRAKTVVLYVSKELEVDTRRLIKRAWKDGKRVAAPRCVENTRLMNMHLIRSMDDLQEGAFGILEPNENLPILHDTRDAICIVPAFCNDFRGYRVGYGGGYYDRYLSSFSGAKIGVNFSDCVRPRLISGRYDVPVDLLVTDRYIRRCTQQKAAPGTEGLPNRGRKETEHEERKGPSGEISQLF